MHFRGNGRRYASMRRFCTLLQGRWAHETEHYSSLKNRKENYMFGVFVAIWIVVSCFKELTNGNGFDDLY